MSIRKIVPAAAAVTDEQLAEWRDLADAALNRSGGWQFGNLTGTPEDVRAEYIDAFDRGTPGVCWAVHVEAGPEHAPIKSLVVATTGNGPTSETHAKFIAWSSPGNIRLLIDELREARGAIRRLTALSGGLERAEARLVEVRDGLTALVDATRLAVRENAEAVLADQAADLEPAWMLSGGAR